MIGKGRYLEETNVPSFAEPLPYGQLPEIDENEINETTAFLEQRTNAKLDAAGMIELDDFLQKRQDRVNLDIAETSVGLFSSINLGTFFTFFLGEAFRKAFLQHAHYFLLPANFLAGLIELILTWREAQLNGWAKSTVAKAAVSTLAFAAMSTAIIGTLFFKAAFSTVSAAFIAALFVASGALRTLYNLGAGIANTVFGIQAKIEGDSIKANNYFKEATQSYVSAFVGALFTGAMAATFLLGKPLFAALGIAGAGISAVLGVIKGVKTYKEHQQLRTLNESMSSENTVPAKRSFVSTLKIWFGLQQEPKPQVSVINNNIPSRPKSILRPTLTPHTIPTAAITIPAPAETVAATTQAAAVTTQAPVTVTLSSTTAAQSVGTSRHVLFTEDTKIIDGRRHPRPVTPNSPRPNLRKTASDASV